MGDEVAWWRGDDKSHQNDKLLAVGLLGTGLHFRATSWCASQETDGRLPVGVIPSLSPELTPKARKALVKAMTTPIAVNRAPLWTPEIDESETVIAYHLNDFLKFNPSHAQLEAKRKAEKERLAGRRAPA